MPRPLSDRIAAIKAKKEMLAVRLGQLEAKEKKDARKRDTRRKIIVGGAILAAMHKDEVLDRHVRRVLAAYVGRQQDKDVLGDLLAPSPAPADSHDDAPRKEHHPVLRAPTATPPDASPATAVSENR